MDAELRERFDKSDARAEKIESKIDGLTNSLGRHMTESAVRDQQALAGVSEAKITISQHLDEHKERRGWWAALWGGVILAVIASAWNFITGRAKLLLILPAFMLAGCAFGEGFSREMQKQMADDIGAAVEHKLGDDFKGIGDAVAGGIKAIPQPAAPKEPVSPLYDLGAAAAIIVAFLGRGLMRKYNVLGAGEVRVKKDS